MKNIYIAILSMTLSLSAFAAPPSTEEAISSLELAVTSIQDSISELKVNELKMSMYTAAYRIAYTETGDYVGRVYTKYTNVPEYFLDYSLNGKSGYLSVSTYGDEITSNYVTTLYSDEDCEDFIILRSSYEIEERNYYLEDEVNYIASTTCTRLNCYKYMHEVDVTTPITGSAYSLNYDFKKEEEVCKLNYSLKEYYSATTTVELDLMESLTFPTYYFDELPDEDDSVPIY